MTLTLGIEYFPLITLTTSFGGLTTAELDIILLIRDVKFYIRFVGNMFDLILNFIREMKYNY